MICLLYKIYTKCKSSKALIHILLQRKFWRFEDVCTLFFIFMEYVKKSVHLHEITYIVNKYTY